MSWAVCIVQARMGSTRLPGKVLMDLGQVTVLENVLNRCAAIPGIDAVCCALPEGKEDDPAAEVAKRAGAMVVRGASKDVLSRYATAARAAKADFIMRVTSDCPLIDPDLCGEVLSLLRHEDADIAANDFKPTFPHGLDCEVFSSAALLRADAESTDAHDREHVTPWLRRHPELKRASLEGPGGEASCQRWTLDWPEDLDFMQALFALGPVPCSWIEVMALIEEHPEITALNAGRRITRALER